jgi:S1-C subfamily serine protease
MGVFHSRRRRPGYSAVLDHHPLPGHRGTSRWSAGLIALAAVIELGIAAAPTTPSMPERKELAGNDVVLTSQQLELFNESPPAQPADPAATAAPVDAGLVEINTTLDYQNATGTGTGIVLDPGGAVLTNNHVVSGATGITATDVGNGHTYPADVIGYDRRHDIAVVQLHGATGLTTAPLGDSSQAAVGDPVVGIGNAGGGGSGLSREPGKVTALNQTITASDDLTGSSEQLTGLIGVAADLRPGDSGGPLVNSAGQVIGIDTAGSGSYRMGTSGGHGFAIPINQALSIAAQIRAGAASSSVHIGDSALLGVGVTDARGSRGSSTSGVMVRQVLRGAPADQAGLAPGDLITALDGNAVDSANTLTNLLDQHHPGDNVGLTWVDTSGKQHTVTVVLATGPVG